MTSDILLLGGFALLALIAWIWSIIVGFRLATVWGILVILFHPLATFIMALTNWTAAGKPFLLSLVATVGLAYFAVSYIWNASGAGAMFDIVQRQASGEITEIEAAREARDAMVEQLERMHSQGLISDEELAEGRAEANRQFGIPEEGEAPVDPGSLPGAVPETEVVIEDPDAPAGTVPATATPQETMPEVVPEAAPEVTPEVAAAEPEPKPVIKPPVLPEHRRRALTPRGPVIRTIGFEKAGHYIGKKVWVVDKTGRERTGILTRVGPDHVVLERRLGKGAMSFVVYDDQIKQIRVELEPGEH
ncbi:MAG TPA: hypothetical protein ENJ01_11525 [Gammaproteobacteria bacterium]|nr:hypothetical protein [Gammaproteobacteria bacterium]